jgi:hypothetical protein
MLINLNVDSAVGVVETVDENYDDAVVVDND